MIAALLVVILAAACAVLGWKLCHHEPEIVVRQIAFKPLPKSITQKDFNRQLRKKRKKWAREAEETIRQADLEWEARRSRALSMAAPEWDGTPHTNGWFS